jgi:hypothetical protein
MATNVKEKFGTGLSPQEFIDSMTVNKEKFEDLYKRFEWEPADQEFFGSHDRFEGLHCFILSADWCGDVVRNVPVVFRVMEQAGIPTEVLVMEKNIDVMDQFLTMGGRAIPIVLLANQNGDVVGQWGPRSKHVQAPMIEFKSQNPDRQSVPDYDDKIKAVYAEIISRYGEGTGYQRDIVRELRELF